MANNRPVYVTQHNHFDPIWRRCWDRTFDYKGNRYRSYADLEGYFIDIWLENAKKGAVFSEGQAVVFRKYLERNPQRLAEMREMVKKGLIELTAAGETVADTNMPAGETLLRNLVMGQLYFEETFGVIPSVGWLEDAFGQSAQIPQIFRGCECNQVLKRCYKAVPGDYWKGLDGSVIFTADAPYIGNAGHCIKIPPCPECHGVGCDKCGGTGLDTAKGAVPDDWVRGALGQDFTGDPFSMFLIGGEEAVPNPRLVELVEQARKEHKTDFRFGGFGKIAEHYADRIAKLDDPNLEVSDEVEANPVSTGCYVTRIKIKQEFRRLENLVNEAERWATVAHLMGLEYPSNCLTRAWRDVTFVAFHDAITSTHIDAAYHELMDMLEDAECEAGHVVQAAFEQIESEIKADPHKTYLALYNPESWEREEPVTVVLSGTTGKPGLVGPYGEKLDVLDVRAAGGDLVVAFRSPKIPALGYALVELVPDTEPVNAGDVTSGKGEIENEFFRIRVDERGIASVIDKRTSQELLDTSKYLLNELILEEDIGHPWGTMQPPSFEECLSKYTTGVSIRKAEGFSEISLTGAYKGDDPNVKVLSWRQWVKLYDGFDRIDFRTEIDWDTAQRRIRVAVPTSIKTDDGIYSIPYGALKRGKYEPDMSQLPSTNGDWPAVNWVDLHGEADNRGYALINTGTPSHKIEDGVIFMSLLRSPTDCWCLNEPEYYDCPDFDGARDAGSHEFHYSLIPHPGDYRSANIERRAREVNNPLTIRVFEGGEGRKLGLSHSFISLDAPDNVIVTAIKKAERNNSVIVRLAETAGAEAEASVSIEGAGKKAALVNYLERNDQPVTGKVRLAPFKVVTVRLAK
jgi:alpha-mannosidase